ncbi:MAG: YdeI/OmpD-associated family protein [Pseudonocardiaceae bacterium]
MAAPVAAPRRVAVPLCLPRLPGIRRAIIDRTTGNRLTGVWLDAMVRHSLDNSDQQAFADYLHAWAMTDFHTEIEGNPVPVKVIVDEHDPALGEPTMQATFRPVVPPMAPDICQAQELWSVAMADEPPVLTVADTAAWRAWLGVHYGDPTGVWLTLAKKGTTEPTSLTYDQALDEALCHGWIDGRSQRVDEITYRQRFTPRRARSPWSKRNVGIIDRLVAEGRMHPGGVAEVERAKADGRWEVAYAGPAAIEVPADLAAALRAEPTALAMFDILTSQNRYAILYRINAAKRADTRGRRIEQFVAMLARGETVYPQRRRLAGSG